MTGSPTDLAEVLAAMRSHDLPVGDGRTLAYVYDSGLDAAEAAGREALAAYAGTNALDPTAFPSLLAMENELVGRACDLLDAPPGAAGSVTSGGTESLVLAVQAARDARPDVDRPRLVVAATAHPALHKAAHLLGLQVQVVPVDPATMRADAEAMVAALDDDVVLVVVSAPSYAHGVVDPVEPVAAAAAERGVRCHVDACIGGWVLPYLTDPLPGWTFAVDGVTSISVDLHKYAYTPKGASVLVHRDAALRRAQLFAYADWPGYPVLNATLQSTRSGAPIAAAWAVTRAIGSDGYADLARAARSATVAIAQAVQGIEHLRVLVDPDSTLLALATDATCDVFTVADECRARGWYVQTQPPYAGGPATLHLSVNAATAARVDEVVAVLGESVAAAVASGPVAVDPSVAALLSGLDPSALDEATFAHLLAAAGLLGPDGTLSLPDRTAPVDALLAQCPPRLREALLLALLDSLTGPVRTHPA